MVCPINCLQRETRMTSDVVVRGDHQIKENALRTKMFVKVDTNKTNEVSFLTQHPLIHETLLWMQSLLNLTLTINALSGRVRQITVSVYHLTTVIIIISMMMIESHTHSGILCTLIVLSRNIQQEHNCSLSRLHDTSS